MCAFIASKGSNYSYFIYLQCSLYCVVLGFILAISNKVTLYANQTYLHVLAVCVKMTVCVSFGVTETKDDLPLKLIV